MSILTPSKESIASSSRSLRIASVCTVLPTADRVQHGIFVKRRLGAMRRYADVRVLNPSPWFPFVRPRASRDKLDLDNFTTASMFYFPGVFKHLDGYWLSRSIRPVLRRWTREYGLDLIDAHFGYPEGVGCVRAADCLGLPSFITLRGNEVMYLQQPRIARQMLSSFKSATGIIAVSESLKAFICEHGVEEGKTRVIPNATDTSLFFPGDRANARRRLGLDPSKRMLLVVGHLIHRKGNHLVVPAVAQLRRRMPDVECFIVGGEVAAEVGYARELRRSLHARGLGTTVHLVGVKAPDEMGDWYRAADLLVLPSYREGCSNAVLEALACGVPVVTTPVGDNAKYVIPGLTGALAPVDDAVALAATIEEALHAVWDPEIISTRVTAEGWAGVARQVMDFFQQRLRTERNGRASLHDAKSRAQ